jgi:hypothetical protein
MPVDAAMEATVQTVLRNKSFSPGSEQKPNQSPIRRGRQARYKTMDPAQCLAKVSLLLCQIRCAAAEKTERPLSARLVQAGAFAPLRAFTFLEPNGSLEAGGMSLGSGQGLPSNLCARFRDGR